MAANAEWLWFREQAREWAKKNFRPRFVDLPTQTPDLCREVRVERFVDIPMRDRVKLRADIYRPGADLPGGARPLPVILIRMPYGKRENYTYMPAHARFWARKGYVCVVQDVRGKWSSQGVWAPYENEPDDGWDTLDWVAAQPWCDGSIGMTGESYYGSTQWAVAPLGHPNLKCLAPGDVDSDRYSAVHDGGALCFATAGAWAWEMNGRRYLNHYRFDTRHLPLATTDEVAGKRSPAYQNLIRHPSRDRFWDEANAACRYENVTVPMLHWGGWYDVHNNGTFVGWRRVRDGSKSAPARGNQWVLMGGTDHELWPEFSGRVGRTTVPNHGYCHDRVRAFMDFWLKGVDNGFGDSPRVQYYVVGGGRWRGAPDWPPPEVESVCYHLRGAGRASTLAGDGALALELPGEEPPDTFVYDPLDPVSFWVGRNVWEMGSSLGDRREVERRADVLVYTSPELEAPLEVTGPIVVKLFAVSSACDSDFTAGLVDVFPDGSAQLVREGIIRARYRLSEREPELIEPGQVYEYTIDLASTSYVFARGHRLRLEISSSNFDRYDRNQNTGREYGLDAATLKATQTILHDAAHPSHILLPVMHAGDSGSAGAP